MGSPVRRCTECGAPLTGRPGQLTCSPAHRAQRKRRLERESKADQLKRDRDAAADQPGTLTNRSNDDVAEVIGRKRDDIIRQTFVEELRPVVREAIDENVIRAIQGMVGLAPSAVLALQADLESDDAVLRSKAAALVVKYTLGNPNVTPPRADSQPGLTIINNLPDAPPTAIEIEPMDEAELVDEETRRCDTCNLPKSLSDFPAGGPRCAQCLAERKAQALESLDSKFPVTVAATREVPL